MLTYKKLNIKQVVNTLLQLQVLYKKHKLIQKELEKGEKEIAGIKTLINSHEKALNEIIEKIQDKTNQKAVLKKDLEDERERLARVELELKSEKKAEVLEELERQKSIIKHKIISIEKNITKLDKEIEEMEIEKMSAEANLQDLKKQLETRIKEINELNREKMEELKNIENEMSQIKQKLPSTLYNYFLRILELKKGKAIVKVEDNTCYGCHIILPPAIEEKLYKTEELVQCPICYRFLYLPEWIEDENLMLLDASNNL